MIDHIPVAPQSSRIGTTRFLNKPLEKILPAALGEILVWVEIAKQINYGVSEVLAIDKNTGSFIHIYLNKEGSKQLPCLQTSVWEYPKLISNIVYYYNNHFRFVKGVAKNLILLLL